MDRESSRRVRTYSHWGAYDVEVEGEAITAVHAYHDDPDPSPIGQSFRDAIHHRTRIARPAVRRGWLERGPENHGGGRGAEPFVEVSCTELSNPTTHIPTLPAFWLHAAATSSRPSVSCLKVLASDAIVPPTIRVCL